MTSRDVGPSPLRRRIGGSIGDIAFGFSDGAISVAGLIFGVAAGTNDSRIVVLAGISGAVAAAVSMMAGRFLDIQSVSQGSAARVSEIRRNVAQEPQPYLLRVERRLAALGYNSDEVRVVREAMRRNPEALVDHISAYEVNHGGRDQPSPWSHALWMFAAVLFAGLIPVLPFTLLPIDVARIVALIVTIAMMGVLGIVRGRIGHVNIWVSAIQTILVAGIAAVIGITIGTLIG